MARRNKARIIFITGTDTGVGKTVLTALLLHHLRQRECHALAIKPFCSGSRADVILLEALQDGVLSLDEINPFYFTEPLAPLIAARKHHRRIPISAVLTHVLSVAPQFKVQSSKFKVRGSLSLSSLDPRPSALLIEGIGGLVVPLGEGFAVLDLIARLTCEVIVVSQNRLGTINHTLLTIKALQAAGIQSLKVVLTDAFPPRHSTPGTRSNPGILSELLTPIPLFHLPYLGSNPSCTGAVKANAKKLQKTLAQILV